MSAALAVMSSMTAGIVILLKILKRYEGVLWLFKQCDS